MKTVALTATGILILLVILATTACEPELTFQEGYEAGYEEGYRIGHAEGYQDGHSTGYQTGHDEGVDAGAEMFMFDAIVKCPFCRREFIPVDYDAFIAP